MAVCRACNELLESQAKDKATNTYLDLCPRCLLESNAARFKKSIATTEDVNELLATVSQMQRRNNLLQ